MEPGYEDICAEIRAACLELETKLRAMMQHSAFECAQSHTGQHSEMRANTMLSVRHLEDARMRVGKMIQAYDGGKSVYTR